jgi:hypothetical protein
MIEDLRWFVALNVVLAIWVGLLAESWKGRRMFVWAMIGFAISLPAVFILAVLPKVERHVKRRRESRDAVLVNSYATGSAIDVTNH